MARYRSHSSGPTLLFLFAAATIWTYRAWLAYVLYGLAIVLLLVVAIKLYRFLMLRRMNKFPADIDTMNGLDFERYIADLLKRHGFYNVSLTEQFDMGVDIIAEKDGVRWGIQVKRHSGLVKAAAVRQVVTALNFYSCERAMVVTNSTYSNVARQLAESNDCVLVSRTELQKLIG